MRAKTNSRGPKGKQNGKSNAGKIQSQENNADKKENGEDYSVLRKSIDIAADSFSQVSKMFHSGTGEVHQVLQYECSLIYECKVCRNLFRSVANLLSHKRVYCREHFADIKHPFPANHVVEDSTTIVQPEAVPSSPCKETWATSDVVPNPSSSTETSTATTIGTSVPRISSYTNPKKDLSQIIERLAEKRGTKTVTETVAHISASNFYNTVNEQLKAKNDARKEHVIRLESVENTRFGVFQTVLQSSSTVQMENTDLMRTQVVELHNMMTCNEATLGPDGKIAMLNGEGTTELAITAANSSSKDTSLTKKQDGLLLQSTKPVSPKEDHVCKICNTRFSTRKTLSHHMKSLHVTFRMCYPCPCCKNTFCNTWSVYRHLYKVHRKTNLQVRKLRQQIVNKAFKKEVSEESQNPAGKSNDPDHSEADRARREQQRLHQENQAWMNNFEDDLELQMCGGCGRRFERRAALTSHSQICQKRIAIKNNIKAANRLPVPSNSRVSSTKTSPSSSERSGLPQAENSRNNDYTDNTNRLTPLSLQSDHYGRGVITPSPSPVPTELSNQFLSSSPTANKTRHCSGSSIIVKKEAPEKKIEIQIRRDYCKTGTSSASSVSGGSLTCNQQQECNCESNDQLCDGNDDDLSSLHEDSKYYQVKDLRMGMAKKNDRYPNLQVCRYPTGKKEDLDDMQIPMLRLDSDNDDDYGDKSSIRTSPSNISGDLTDRSANSSRASKQSSSVESVVSNRPNRRMSRNSEETESTSDGRKSSNEKSKSSEEPSQSVPKKEEQYSPVMESRMQNMINIRRLQCLPCQKKFNKLTNLRRHVAMHISWNRYRCSECSFKCFSKYDCVAHVNKMHMQKVDREKAQSMVQYIETQVSDNEVDESKKKVPEEIDGTKSDSGNEEIQEERLPEMKTDPAIVISDCSVDSSENKSIFDSKLSDQETSIKKEDCMGDINEDFLVKDEEKSVSSCIKEEESEKEIEFNETVIPFKSKVEDDTKSVVETLPTKRPRGRPRKRRFSTDCVGLQQTQTVLSKKPFRASVYRRNIKDVTAIGMLLQSSAGLLVIGVGSINMLPGAAVPLPGDIQEKQSTSETDDNASRETSVSREESPSKTQSLQEQSDLRKMVLQVIFGGGSNAADHEMANPENVFSITMNGEHDQTESSPDPYDIIETNSNDSVSPNPSASSMSTMLTSESMVDLTEAREENRTRRYRVRNSVTPTLDIERKQRPVRNRIRVEREDFIYDLSDKCLEPKRDGDKLKRKPQESVKVLTDRSIGDGSKVVPKLTLMRTSSGDLNALKSSSSSNTSLSLEGSSDGNAVSYNISTRKSQRTFDISPHKTKQQ